MKRCPECRRDYYDDSLLFCLDDGSALLDGPRKSEPPAPTGGQFDEPQTAILHGTSGLTAVGTQAQIHTTGQTVMLPPGGVSQPSQASGRTGFDKWLILIPVLLVLMALAGFLGYRYLAAPGQIGSIAVLPFVNETANPDAEYLSDGMTETLIKGLSNIPDLNVKPRASVFRYKGASTDLKTIARELNVQAVLNGRVTQRGDQLTVSLELIDVPNDKVIWTEQYQRRQSDVVSLQSEIAKDVSARIRAKLTGTEEEKVTRTGTNDPEAYQAYLKGRYLWNRRTALNINRALEQFQIATERDSNYALAFVGLADCYVVLGEYAGTPSSETLPMAKAFAERAIALDGGLAEAYATLGAIADGLWQWAESEEHFKRAIGLNPNYATAYHWYSIRLRAWGRYDEAVAMIMRAQELDPVSSVIAVNVARTYHLINNEQAAIETLQKLIQSDPGFPAAHQYLALVYLHQGRSSEAVASIERAVELGNRSAITLSDLGYVYALTGKTAEARAVLKELEAMYSKKESHAGSIAAVHVALGDRDKAFEWLEKSFEARSNNLAQARWIPQYDSVRDDPRYKDLMRRMNLPQ